MIYPVIFLIVYVFKLSFQNELVKFAEMEITTTIVDHSEVVNQTQELPQNITDPCRSSKKGMESTSCRVVTVDLQAMDAASMNIPGCTHLIRTTQFQYYPRQSVDGSYESKRATYQNKDCIASLEASHDHVTGTVEKRSGIGFDSKKIFKLESCNAFPSCHIWMEITKNYQNDRMIPELRKNLKNSSLKLFPIMKRETMRNLRQKGIMDNTTVVDFSVKFYYNQDFYKATPEPEKFINEMARLVNLAFNNSKIPVTMKVHCIEFARNLSDIIKARDALRQFRIFKGANYRNVLGGADVAVLLVNQMYPSCGVAQTNALRNGIGINVENKSCAEIEEVVQHELGHTFGCVHDLETQKKENAPDYKYGHGTYVKVNGTSKRTIMSYPRTAKERPINYFSSPNVKYKGKTIGSSIENCARVIRENRFAIAAISDETEPCINNP